MISKTSSQLLGQNHGAGSARAGELVGKVHDPFRKQDPVSPDHIIRAIELFSRKSDTNYAARAPLLHRLAEAQRTFGRFAKEDRILDLVIIFERYSPEEKTCKNELSLNISNLLGQTTEESAQISEGVEHYYKVRNAIVHGCKKEGDSDLLLEIDLALGNGFRFARTLLLNSICEISAALSVQPIADVCLRWLQPAA
ncbi:hypothetical protein ACOTTU_22430 [Roseobacter sp. EG26]